MSVKPDNPEPATVAAVDAAALQEEALAALAAAATADELTELRTRYLGRKSELKQALRNVRDRETGMTLNALYAQPRTKAASCAQVGNEFADCREEEMLVFSRKRRVVSIESSRPVVGWQALRLEVPAKRLEELRVVHEALHPTGRDVLVRLTLTCLPLGRPVPRLRRVDDLLWAKQNALIDDLDLDRIAFLEPGRRPDLGGKRENATLGELRASHCCISE